MQLASPNKAVCHWGREFIAVLLPNKEIHKTVLTSTLNIAKNVSSVARCHIYWEPNKGIHKTLWASILNIAKKVNFFIPISRTQVIFMLRPHVSRYFWKRIYFYPFRKDLRPHENALTLWKRWITSMSMRRQAVGLFFCVWSPNFSRLWHKLFQKDAFYPPTEGKRSFQKNPLWRAFSKRGLFDEQKLRLRVDGSPKVIRKYTFSKISGWCGHSVTHFIAL